MKLVCDACNAKYSIGDDRIAGKVFKIRCKKCNHVMVVRGGAAEPAVEPAPVGEFYVVIDGDQVGPISRADLMARRATGALDDDTFVWREGMDEWAAYASIDELREQTRVEPEPDLFARAVATDIAGELAPPPEPKAEELKLRGERNENSVLFTLGNLAKLAAPQPKPSAGAAAAGGTEGSGLIDIRALAGTFASAKPAPSARGSDADLPAFAPVGFDAAPIVMLPMPRRRPDRKLVYALVATLAMLAIVGTVLVIVMTRGDRSAMAATPAPQLATIGTPPPPVEAPAPKVETPAPAPKVEPAPAPPPVTPKAIKTPAPRPQQTPAPIGAKPPKPVLAIKEPEKQECTEVHCAYSGYAEKCCEAFRPKTGTTTTGTGNLPENLDKDALKAGIATISAQSCGNASDKRGDVAVSIKVSAGGSVTAVTIKSSPDPALSACVSQRAQRGTFAKTKRGGSFAYVWRF